MSPKAIVFFCAQALLAQAALSQCLGRGIDGFGLGPFGLAGSAFAPGLAGPFAFDGFPGCGLGGPLAFDGYRTGFGYDGFAGPFGYDGLAGWGVRSFAPAMEITPTTSGGLTVTSASAIPPTGISVISENAYEGILTVAGAVPFVGTTGMEGIVPTAGAAAVNHACGNGINAMVSETTAFMPAYAGAAIAPAFGAAISPVAAFAPAAGYAGCGYAVY